MNPNPWKWAVLGFVLGAGFVVLLYWSGGNSFERGSMISTAVGNAIIMGLVAGWAAAGMCNADKQKGA